MEGVFRVVAASELQKATSEGWAIEERFTEQYTETYVTPERNPNFNGSNVGRNTYYDSVLRIDNASDDYGRKQYIAGTASMILVTKNFFLLKRLGESQLAENVKLLEEARAEKAKIEADLAAAKKDIEAAKKEGERLVAEAKKAAEAELVKAKQETAKAILEGAAAQKELAAIKAAEQKRKDELAKLSANGETFRPLELD